RFWTRMAFRKFCLIFGATCHYLSTTKNRGFVTGGGVTHLSSNLSRNRCNLVWPLFPMFHRNSTDATAVAFVPDTGRFCRFCRSCFARLLLLLQQRFTKRQRSRQLRGTAQTRQHLSKNAIALAASMRENEE